MSTEITRDLLIDTMQRAYTRRGDVIRAWLRGES